MDESATARLKLCGSANFVKGTQLSNSQIESNLLSKNRRVRVPSFTAKTGVGGGFRFKGWWSQDLQQLIVTFNKSDKVGAVHDWAITSIIITWLRCSCLYLLPQTLDNLAPIKILKLSNCCNVKFWGNRSGDGGGWQGVEFNYTSWTPCSKFGHHLVIYGIIWYFIVYISWTPMQKIWPFSYFIIWYSQKMHLPLP